MAGGPHTVTALLRAWRGGERDALDQVIELVYAELHRLAGAFVRGERAGSTFRATDLVSEAYLRLGGSQDVEWTDRAHFFAIAARATRQALVDHARRRSAGKRGAGRQAVTLDESIVVPDRFEELLCLDLALSALAAEDERKARTVELHYFAGLGHAEIARVLEVGLSTVARDLRFAEAWLHRHMSSESS